MPVVTQIKHFLTFPAIHLLRSSQTNHAPHCGFFFTKYCATYLCSRIGSL